MMPEDETVDEGTGVDEQPGTDTGADASADNGNPGQPNSDQPVEDWEGKYSEEHKQTVALNRLLVDARRQANSNKGLYKPGQVNDQGNEGQPGQPTEFGTALKIATSDLRTELDGILELYPELPVSVAKQIRKSPWGYANQDSLLSLNIHNALLDIEQYVADSVAGLSPETPSTQEPQAPIKVPASKVKPNAAPEGVGGDEDVVPGSPEDANPYTMPLDKLERKVARKVRK